MDYDLFMGGKGVKALGGKKPSVNNCYNNVNFYSVTAGN